MVTKFLFVLFFNLIQFVFYNFLSCPPCNTCFNVVFSDISPTLLLKYSKLPIKIPVKEHSVFKWIDFFFFWSQDWQQSNFSQIKVLNKGNQGRQFLFFWDLWESMHDKALKNKTCPIYTWDGQMDVGAFLNRE